MPTHPNRSGRGGAAATPTPAQIRAARQAAGLTQTEAAALIHSTYRAWQEWEGGRRRMHPGLWALFCLRTPPAQK
jgi:DNA-binding transcriptional regulator YiaG